ncbi:MAG: ABC transporter ATP-binding protein [Acidobacteria bacterium]|nr:ABC transporter ATP-binding protein [Acidobacteriota bacterium]
MSTPSQTGSESPIVLTNISKLFGRFAVLRDISARFQPGHLYAIFGDNGAGKSTLLRVIAGLARASAGTVKIFGQSRSATAKSRLGYMAHAPLLYDEMTGMENLRYFAGLYGISNTARCEQAMRTVGLDPALARRAGEYSQGMRQRLSLARATLHDPEIVLLDEPFSNLDPHSAEAMGKVLGRMRDEGKTILVVTHQAGHVADVADESIWMSTGHLAEWEPGIGASRYATGARP